MKTMRIIKSTFSSLLERKRTWFRGKNATEAITESKNTTASKDFTHNIPDDISINLSHNLPCDEFISTVPKPKKAVTVADKVNFRQYLLGKKVDLKVTAEEIKTLFGYEGEEFRLKSFEFMCNKMNIPADLRPVLTYNDNVNVAMSYDFILNTIQINPNFAEELSNKTNFLAGLRHEFQHYLQNMAMFRHETKGEELISIYSKMASKNVHRNIDYYARNCSLDKLAQIFDEQGMKDLMYMKELLKNKKIEEYQAYLHKTEEDTYKQFYSSFTNLRKHIVDNMGVIKKDSTEGKRAERMINDTASEYSYWTDDGNIRFADYITDMREVEALAAQDMMTLRINAATSGNDKYCYIKIMKETQEKMKKQAELNPELKNLTSKNDKINKADIKQILTYLYD